MKRTALLIACTFLLFGVHDAAAANHFHVGGASQSSGTVRVRVDGGAGRHPQFRIGGGRFHGRGNYFGAGGSNDTSFGSSAFNYSGAGSSAFNYSGAGSSAFNYNGAGSYNSVGRYGNVASRRAVAGNYSVAVSPGGYGYGGYGGSFGSGGFSNLYNQGFIPVPPYYSLHPPVYYSVPVPRTYGYSPFAYPGYVPTPEVTFSEPEIIDNPHVEPEEAPAPAQETSAQTAAAPLVIRNPFVEQADVVLTAQHVK